jgi:hypothetical protein
MKILKLFGFLLISSTLIAQEQPKANILDGLFESAYFGKPFMSEIHSTISKIELGYSKSYSEFNLLEENQKFERPVVEMHLGMDAPLFAYQWGTAGKSFKWGVAISLPLSVHVLEDMWDPVTAPVINTDYRFGSPRIRAIRNFEGNRFFKNVSVSWLPIFHECTHLGDEITIYRKDEKFPITRINVSYEYTELQLTLNDPDKSRDTRHSFRIGGMYRISNRGYGWYSIREDAEATQPVVLLPSNYHLEYYGQYQFQRSSGFLASKRIMNILSFEARNRLRYGIPMFRKVNEVWETTEVKERLQWNYNLYFGWKFYPKSNLDHSLSFLLHAYKGINPYGQLRNYPSYPFFGFSIAYEP